jgi:hypothetical protein
VHVVLYNHSVPALRFVASVNVALFGTETLLILVLRNETVMANAILGYIIVGIILTAVGVVSGAFWVAGRLNAVAMPLRRKWLRQ